MALGLTVRADVEPNNSIATAEAAALGTLNGTVGPADLDDFYAVTLPDDGTLNFTLTTTGGLQARTVVYNASGSALLFGGYVTGGVTSGSVSCLAAGTVYIHVDRNAGDDAYTLDLSLASPVEANDPEPNGSIGTALSLPFTGSAEGHSGFVNGSVAPLDADDYYLTLPVEEGRINARAVLGGNLQARLILYNSAGSLLLIGGYAIADTATLSYDCLAPDTLYLHVDRNSGCGGYTVEYDWIPPALAGDPEPNNAIAEATAMSGFSEVTGRLGYVNAPDFPLDQDDYYVTKLPTNGNVNVRLITDNSLQARIIFYNRNGTLLTFGGYALNDTVELPVSCMREDTAYIRVDWNSGCGSYRLEYTVDSPDVASDLEPNDSFDDAIFLGQGLGSGRTGHIGFVNGTADQDDYYFGVPTQDGRVSIRIINDGAQQSRVLFYNENRALLSFSAFSTDTVVFDYDCVAGGDTLYFQVDNNSGCGGYRLSYQVIPNGTPNDVEPNNSISESGFVGEGLANATTGHLGYSNGSDNPIDASDYFAAVPADDGKITIYAASTNTLQQRVLLYSKGGGLLSFGGYVIADTATLTYDCLAADTLYLRVERASGCGGYTLWYEMENPPQANDVEPNNSIAEALVLGPNTPATGHLGYFNTPIPTDAADFYRYSPQDTGNLTFTVILGNTLQARLRLYNSAGASLLLSGYVVADTVSLSYFAPNTNDLYVHVDRAGGCGGYTLSADNGCPQPTGLTETLIISIGAQVDWADVPSANAYNIQGKRATGSTFATASGIPNSNYRAFPLQSCADYQWRVEAICGLRSSGYTPLKNFTTLCAPFCPALSGVTVASVGSTTATIGWAPSIVNTGAQLQYTPVGGSTQTATAPGGQNFVNLTGLTPSTTYDFQVRQSCYDGGISPFVNGSFSTTALRDGVGIEALVYPNPTSDRLIVEGLDANTDAVILNAQGQVVLQAVIRSGADELDVSGLAPGHYALRLTGERASTLRFSIVR
jgi:hypothetical protein